MTMQATAIPTIAGTLFEGGLYVGRYFIGNQARALIVSPKDTEIAKAKWGPVKRVDAALSYNAGAANTEAMVAAGSKLAVEIRALRAGDFDDWYLPSRIESLLLFGELREQFEEAWYWTSAQYEHSNDCAWIQYFYNGTQGNDPKGYHCRARAVRSIVIE
jgi:hypothetical protein